MIDLGLISLAKKAVALKERHFITPAILLAVVNQESHCANLFIDTKPGGQYALNVQDAITHKVRDKTGKVINKIATGLKESEIRQFITLPDQIDGWQVPKEFAGQKSKFRFEYGWWQHAAYTKLPKQERFALSTSWGLVQFMGFNIVGNSGKTGDEAIKLIQRFAADVLMQLEYAAGTLDTLLIRANGDVFKMYKGYNSGDVDSEDPAVIARAKAVAASAIQIDTEIKGAK
ncbi:MAG TPA: hypothetical protein V6D22_16840 [Candidatus Obscuribacterales bacterium]